MFPRPNFPIDKQTGVSHHLVSPTPDKTLVVPTSCSVAAVSSIQVVKIEVNDIVRTADRSTLAFVDHRISRSSPVKSRLQNPQIVDGAPARGREAHRTWTIILQLTGPGCEPCGDATGLPMNVNLMQRPSIRHIFKARHKKGRLRKLDSCRGVRLGMGGRHFLRRRTGNLGRWRIGTAFPGESARSGVSMAHYRNPAMAEHE